jgi:hypothetical protein
MTSGVYQIKNLINNKCYIGSSIEIENRWRRHKKDLRKNKHHSIILQRAWNKYGESNFEFSIIEECLVEVLIIQEQYYLELYEPIYNICRIAGSCLGVTHSKESNEKKRRYALDNNVKPPESTWRDRQKQIAMLDKDTKEVLKTFESQAEACRFLGKDATFVSTLTRAIKRNITAYGYSWSRLV